MPAPAVLVILIAAAELRSPATRSMVQAAQDTLGSAVTLRVEPLAEHASRLPVPPSESSTAYVVVSWQSASHELATIEGRVTGTRDDVSHSLPFAEADPEEERGRSIGFVIASIVAGPLQSAASARAGQTAPPESRSVTPPEPLATHSNKFTFSLAAVGTLPDAAGSFGAYLDGTRDLFSRVGLGVYAEARFGAVAPAQANTRYLSAGAVGRFRLVPLASATDLSFILNLGITQLAVTHFSEDDVTPDAKWAYVASGAGALRLAYHFGSLAAFYGDLGGMTLAGEMTINVRGKSAATIPVVFALGRLGLQARF